MRQLCRAIGLATLLLALALVTTAQGQMVSHSVSITTDSSGDSTDYTPTTHGYVAAIRYVPDGGSPLAAGADLTITDNVTGLAIVTITNVGSSAADFFPTQYGINTVGTFRVPVDGAIKIVTASGGNVLSGTVYVYIQGR